jgi:hypothetical protein
VGEGGGRQHFAGRHDGALNSATAQAAATRAHDLLVIDIC